MQKQGPTEDAMSLAGLSCAAPASLPLPLPPRARRLGRGVGLGPPPAGLPAPKLCPTGVTPVPGTAGTPRFHGSTTTPVSPARPLHFTPLTLPREPRSSSRGLPNHASPPHTPRLPAADRAYRGREGAELNRPFAPPRGSSRAGRRAGPDSAGRRALPGRRGAAASHVPAQR